jgi:calcium-dependent protein kinase
VNTISPNELNKLRTSFVAIDTHNTGTIEIEEFEAAFKIAGIKISNEEIQKAFINIDLAKNGKINYTEFLAASIDQKSFLVKEDLTSAFNFFDVDNDGVIDSKDLKKAFLKSGKDIRNAEEFQKMIQEVNHDKDKISLNEFLKIFGF